MRQNDQILMELDRTYFLFYKLFEVCYSLEPSPVHGYLNGLCFGCLRVRTLQWSTLLGLGTKIFWLEELKSEATLNACSSAILEAFLK